MGSHGLYVGQGCLFKVGVGRFPPYISFGRQLLVHINHLLQRNAAADRLLLDLVIHHTRECFDGQLHSYHYHVVQLFYTGASRNHNMASRQRAESICQKNLAIFC